MAIFMKVFGPAAALLTVGVAQATTTLYDTGDFNLFGDDHPQKYSSAFPSTGSTSTTLSKAMKLKGLFRSAALAAAMAVGATSAHADITYVESVMATGAIGGDAFTNQLVVIAGNANVAATDYGSDFYEVALPSVNITIQTDSAGLVTGGFTDGNNYAFSNGASQVVGIGADGRDFIDTNGVSDDGLVETTGALFGGATGNQGLSFDTTFGSLVINSFTDGSDFQASGTITAPVSSIPEPGAWALMFAGLGVVGFAARRRAAATQRLAV